jgi:alkylation response protein AidB-like acyl-CoA dehydrogenase
MSAELRARFAAHAAAVDAGTEDVRDGLRRLGERGLLDGGLPQRVELVRTVAGGCLASAFAVWSQAMVLEYLGAAPHPEELPSDQLRSGLVTGATALAPAIADLAGRAEVPVLARPHRAGWRLDGPIRWASNLFGDAVVVTPARTEDGRRLVAMFRLDAPGVERTPPADLLALNGTGTGALELHGVATEAVLGRDLRAFMAVCRPAMLLMQSALAVGVAEAAADAAAGGFTGANAVLAGDHRDLRGAMAEAGERLRGYASGPEGLTGAQLARLRLDAMRLAAEAVRLESVVAGGGGYRAGSPTSRRVREVAFLPVQAPTEGHLRTELAAGRPLPHPP